MQTQYFPLEIKGKFYLRHHNINKPSAIFFIAHIGRKQVKHYIGAKVYPDQWNHKRQCAYISPILSATDNYNNNIVNKTIEAFNQRFSEFKSYLCNTTVNIDTIASLKTILNGMARSKKPSKKIENIIEYMRRAVINDTTLQPATAKNYIQKGLHALKFYFDYLEREKNEKIDDFRMFTTEFFNTFASYILNNYIKPDGEPYSISTINSILKYAKSTVILAARAGSYMTEAEISVIKLRQFDDKSSDNNIALRDDEVMKLYRHQCDNERDEIVRDMFLLECTLGHRIADILRIDERVDEIGGKHYITIAPKKTPNKKVEVDIIFDIAKKILIDKYNCKLPDCNKEMINRNIKRIAKDAGISGEELQSYHYAGHSHPTEVKKPRYELIATHTGRRTFVSMLTARGWTYERISKYTGQTIEMVEHYDKSTAKYAGIYKQYLKEHPADIVRLCTDNEKEPVMRCETQNTLIETSSTDPFWVKYIKKCERQNMEIGQLKNELDETSKQSEYKIKQLKHAHVIEQQIAEIQANSVKDEKKLLEEFLEMGMTYEDYLAFKARREKFEEDLERAEMEHDTLLDD